MTLMLGGIGGRRRRGRQRMRWLGGITDLMDMSLRELRELVMNREAWRAAIHGVTKNRTWLSDWTEGIWRNDRLLCWPLKRWYDCEIKISRNTFPKIFRSVVLGTDWTHVNLLLGKGTQKEWGCSMSKDWKMSWHVWGQEGRLVWRKYYLGR